MIGSHLQRCQCHLSFTLIALIKLMNPLQMSLEYEK